MIYIKSIIIKGFKKFEKLTVSFNEHMNILVGDNEAGKSTILEAIRFVLFQQNKNTDKVFLRDLFNQRQVAVFKDNPCVEHLPKIYIEISIALDPKAKDSEYFFGEVNMYKNGDYGVALTCEFDQELGSGLENQIRQGIIPYDYYKLQWVCFSGAMYSSLRKPFRLISIENSDDDSSSAINFFSRSLFYSLHDDSKRLSVKNSFRGNVSNALQGATLERIDEHRQFGINDKRITLESVLTVFENGISLENKGKGMESLIKTQIALNRNVKPLDVILMEEPETHLSFSTMRKMIKEISAKQEEAQIIITTHSDLIASHLDLRNILWIDDMAVRSLKDINEDDAHFFQKADNNGLLKLLLSKKILLVEGATEALVIPELYKQVTQRDIDEDEIAVISCNGISYNRFLAIATIAQKRTAVLTDNDEKPERIIKASMFNQTHSDQHVYMGQTLEEWTWEACFYKLNQAELDEIIVIDERFDYKYKDKCYGKRLGKMLNNKVDFAYQMLTSGKKFAIPEYIKDAFKWLNE